MRHHSQVLQLACSSAPRTRNGDRDHAIVAVRHLGGQPRQPLDKLEGRIGLSTQQRHISANIKDVAGLGFI